jgi:SAM-dependent methyltransferase
MSRSIQSCVKEFSESLEPRSKVLDVGCGLKPYQKFFSHCAYLVIDVHASGRALDSKKPDQFFDGVKIPFGDDYFDGIICTEVLEHSVAPEILMSEMHRTLKKGGLLLVTVPFIWGEHEAPYDFLRYSTYGVRKLITEAKFSVIQLERLTTGIDAIEKLVHSEINNFNVNVKATDTDLCHDGPKRTLLTRLSNAVWALQLRFWRKLYKFDRVYIDNVIVARK